MCVIYKNDILISTTCEKEGALILPYYEKRPTEYYAFEWRGLYSWQLHLHQQLELLFVENGTVLVTIDYQTQRLHTGDLAVIFPNCVHSYHVPEDAGPDNQLFGMVIVPQLAGDFCEPLSQYVPQSPIITADRLGQEATYAVRRLFEQRGAFRPIMVKSYFQLLLACIWSELSPVQDKNHRFDDVPYRAIRYVMEHYRQPLLAKQVAAELGITQSHLARIFSQRLHTGFNEYVNKLRIQMAQDLLCTTNRPITDIMLDTGFESQSTFNRAFREIHGISPREYRRRFQQTGA